jgi:hypothetical protein
MARWLLLALVHVAWAAVQGPCTQPHASYSTIPPTALEPLAKLRSLDEAVVRLYAAPIPNVTSYAVHPWFVIKKAAGHTLDRWEVWQIGDAPFGYVRKNQGAPEEGVGAGGVFVVAELRGDDAEKIIQFIESQSPSYPCRNSYSFLGPNSNTYAQWVLNETGWRVALPPGAIGCWAVGVCTE